MIWFDLKRLEKKIIENDFSDNEGFSYFLAFLVLGFIVGYNDSVWNRISSIELLVGLVITVWGAYSIFKTNAKGDGQDFFKRYFALAWVVGFRIFVSLLIFFTLFHMVYTIATGNDADEVLTGWTDVIMSSLITLVFYIILKRSFERVSLGITR